MLPFSSSELTPYDLDRLEDVETVRYDGEETDLLEGLDRRLGPQYEMTGKYPDVTLGDYEPNQTQTEELESLEQDYLSNVDTPFEMVVNDSEDGMKRFTAHRINHHEMGGVPTPNSSIAFVSDKKEILGFKVAREYDEVGPITGFDLEKMPPAWKKTGGLDWSEPRPSTGYFVQELDLLLGMGRAQEKLQESPYVPVVPQNYVFVEESHDPDYWNSNHDVGIFYEWTDNLSDIEVDEEVAGQLGRYVATLDKLGLWRGDREPSEIMVTGDSPPDVFEIDRERFVYKMNPDSRFNRDWLLQHLIGRMASDVSGEPTEFSSSARFYDEEEGWIDEQDRRERAEGEPRLAEEIAYGAYREVMSQDEDLSALFAENVVEWEPEKLDDELVVEWFWHD